MATIHVLQHVPHEGPARVADVARAMGHELVLHRLFDGAPLPAAISEGEMLVVLGGPMGVGDRSDPRWPFLAPEAGLIERTLRAERPVLGLCLGAQLMAHALGARVYPCTVGEPPVRHREVGWGPVAFAARPAEEPCLAGMHDAEVVLHWHGDTFDLPSGAVLLASTLACRHQMFRFGRRAFALQFHVEITAADVERWLEEDAAFVRAANGPGGAERIRADTRRFEPGHREVGDRLLKNLFGVMLET